MSGLSNYTFHALKFADELAYMLEEDEIESLHNTCRKIGIDGFLRFALENRMEIADYVGATPSQRKRLKKWSKHAQKELVVLSAIYMVKIAHQTLDDAHFLLKSIGDSYRNMVSEAGLRGMFLLYWKIDFWPDDWPFDDPFDDQ